MTRQSNYRRIAAAAAAALAMTLGSGAAPAQPMGGPHGPGAGEAMIGQIIQRAKAQLNLNTSQQLMFDAAAAQGKAAREAGRAHHQKVKDAMRAELAKAEPDLAGAARIADDAEQQVRTQRQQLRAQWLTLYATFTPEQKAVVRDMLQKRMDHAEAFHQKMRQWMQDHLGATGG